METNGQERGTRPDSPAPQESYGALAEFTLHLVQAMLRTGYYAPDHPAAQDALTGLHTQFKKLIGDRSELTYMVLEGKKSRDITIEGYAPEGLKLDKIMMTGMAELFAPKLLAFFDRWHLLSLSIRAEVAEREFEPFIALISQPPGTDQGTARAGERLNRALADRDVFHISTVFRQDMVGRERHLPWRVKMALSRLRRDLRMLPLYRRASAEQIQKIKLQIIDDVIRPMRTPPLLKEFLINCDLVAADIDVLEENQVEREIISNLSKELLVPTAREIVENLKRTTGEDTPNVGESREHVVGRHAKVLLDITDRLCRVGGGLEHDFLDLLLEQKVLTPAELPAEVRRAMETRHMADAFLAHGEAGIQGLGKLRDDERGRRVAGMVQRIVPDLLRRGEYRTVVEVLRVLEGADMATSPVQARLAANLSNELSDEAILEFLLVDFPYRTKEERDLLVEVLAFIGTPAGPALLQAYEAHVDPSARASIFEALRQIGPAAIRPLLDRLSELEQEWGVIHHILTAAGEVGHASLAPPIEPFTRHENVHVRQAALTALLKSIGAEAEPLFLRALHDPEPVIRQTGIAHLSRIDSQSPHVLEFCVRALRAEGDEPEDDAVLVQACEALTSRVALSNRDAGQIERALLDGLRPVEVTGLLQRFRKPQPRHSDRVQAAICDALAVFGSPAALERLSDLTLTASAGVADRAAAAITEIEGRHTTTPTPQPG